MSHVFEVDCKQMKMLAQEIKEDGFNIVESKDFIFFCAEKNGIRVTIYKSGKLLVQGKSSGEWIEFFLEPKINDLSFTYKHLTSPNYSIPRIGSDESGKGDIVGPLCVAAVFLTEDIEKKLSKGIKDSKSITDKLIKSFAKEISSKCEYQVMVLEPKTYNKLYQKFNNLNKLLGWAHKKTIEELIEKVGPNKTQKIVIDKFATSDLFSGYINTSITIEQRHKAESDLAVACASIIARNSFISWIENKSNELGFELKKGASKSVIDSIYYLKQQIGNDIMGSLVKMHFKPVQKLMEEY